MNIKIGPGYLTFNSGTFRTGPGGVKAEMKPTFRDIETEEFGRIDSIQTDRMIVVSCRLFAAWTNLSILFPTAALAPSRGTPLFGSANLPLVVCGADGSKLTVVNAQITKMANLFLGVSKDIFSADVEFTGLLLNGGNPATAGDYYTYQVNQSYTAPAFPSSSFLAPVVSSSWTGALVNSLTSFAAFNFKDGATIDWAWKLNFEPCKVDGYGTTDAIVEDFEATCKGIPVGVTETDLANALLPAQALGLSENQTAVGDLTLSFGSHSVILHAAFIKETDGFKWNAKDNRLGNVTWRTTVPFSGTPNTAQARAAVS